MNGFRNRLARFMVGRYGMDQLSRFLLYVALALVLIGLFVRWHFLDVLVVLLLIVIYCRVFSRSIYNRQRENQKYLEIKGRFTGRNGGFAGGRREKADGRRVLICPYCKGKLRVPVGAGKIKIRCPHCNREFEETV